MIFTLATQLLNMGVTVHRNFHTMHGHIFMVDQDLEIWEVDQPNRRTRIVGYLGPAAQWYLVDESMWSTRTDKWNIKDDDHMFAPFFEYPLTVFEEMIGDKFSYDE